VGGLAPVCRVLLALGLGAATMTPFVSSAAADPAPDPIAEAKQNLEDARQQANDAAARFSDAESSYDELGNKIAVLQEKIAAGEARREDLRAIAQRRAVAAYKSQGSNLGAVFDAKTPEQSMRSAALLDRANAADNDVIAQLAALNAQLTAQRDQLTEDQRNQSAARDRLGAERELLDAKVAQAYQALLDLQAKAAADAAAARALNPPVINGMVCPLPGAAFTDDFGAPRAGHRHEGIDMFAPMGTAELAVVSGNVTYGDGGAGGMGAYIEGDNGVTFVYYHLSEYVGAPRHVNPGEVVGKVGQTGDATAPHLHFEMRPGGRTAAPVDPYPTLREIC
jgi:murein DD-endopeptidase MepM/ murein hydrolase activator NlpD